MPRVNRPRECKACGKQAEDGREISWRGLCIDCSIGRMAANNRQLSAHSGPYFQHWRERGAAAYGATLLDEVRAKG